MGQHKHNPTAIAAKNGELQPKPKPMSKRERERMLYAKCQEIIYKPLMDVYMKMHTEDVEMIDGLVCKAPRKIKETF